MTRFVSFTTLGSLRVRTRKKKALGRLEIPVGWKYHQIIAPYGNDIALKFPTLCKGAYEARPSRIVQTHPRKDLHHGDQSQTVPGGNVPAKKNG